MSDLILNRSEGIELPSVLGSVKTAAGWQKRREKIRHFFEKNFFGMIPPRPEETRYEIVREVPCFNGLGTRRDVVMHFANHGVTFRTKALWYLPSVSKKVPLIVGLNFCGNAGCTDEPDVELEAGETRGLQTHRWQIPLLLSQGYSLITSPRNHYFQDHEDGLESSIWRLFLSPRSLTKGNRQYTAISAWAWAYSRMLELGETEKRIDRTKIWAHGHSRLGKTALWAGANDVRFAGIVSNDSGCCGAALSRDKHPDGEHYADIKNFTWWFTKDFDKLAGNDDKQDFDMHFLCALTAPRPLLICSAAEDIWADPFNEFRSAKALSPVYRLFGSKGLPVHAHFPKPDSMIAGDKVGYSLRTGKHDVTETDWRFVLKFITKQ